LSNKWLFQVRSKINRHIRKKINLNTDPDFEDFQQVSRPNLRIQMGLRQWPSGSEVIIINRLFQLLAEFEYRLPFGLHLNPF